MSPVQKPTNTPPQMADAEVVDVVLNGIGGQSRSLARWALMELADRLKAAKSDDFSLVPRAEYERLKEMDEAARAFWRTEVAAQYQPCQELRWLWNTLSPSYEARPR